MAPQDRKTDRKRRRIKDKWRRHLKKKKKDWKIR
jgi:hypothetical protein